MVDCDHARKLTVSFRPTVYAQLRRALLAEQSISESPAKAEVSKQTRLEIASEMVDHIFAGFDTGSMVLIFLAWELSKPENAAWQDRIRSEVSALPDASNARALDGLPVLRAVIMESLRVHPPVSGNQVRISPPKPIVLVAPGRPAVTIPPKTRIHAQAWSLHRDPSVFPDPERWDPARWLECSPEQSKEMHRWFWAFGSGSRMCTGMNLAMIELSLAVAKIWGSFKTEIVEDAGMVHNGGFLAGPLGSDGTYLKSRLKHLSDCSC